ncbi:MAG: hypothetical protein ABIS67_10720 [Candidatus Eisenbacteria bacterium]
MAQPLSTSSSDLGRLSRSILTALVLLVAFETALAFVPENVMIRTMHWMRRLLVREPAAAVQIHGDSVSQGALLASEIEKALPPGMRVVNASLQGSGPEFTYFLFKRQVESGRVPGSILIAHSPHTFVTHRMGVLVGAFLGWSEMPEAFLHGRHFFDTLYGVLCKLSFTLRHREELSDLVKGRRGAIRTWEDPLPTEQWVRAAGAADEAKWAREGKSPAGPLHPVYLRGFAVDPGEHAFLARTLALARARNVRVYWLTLPEHEAVAAARDSFGFETAYYGFVDSLAARGEITLLQREFEVLPASEFGDYTHLRLRAALRLSREVGEKIGAGVR